MPKLIAFTGHKGSGKSTAAAGLMNVGYIRTRFADPIKQVMYALGLTYDEVEGHLKEVPCELLGGKTPRYAMQTVGTEWGRDLISPDIWVNVWRREAKRLLDASHSVVVDDLRFPNEFEALKDMGARIVRVIRPGVEVDTSHESERHIDTFATHFVLLNDKPVEQLHREVVEQARIAGEVTL